MKRLAFLSLATALATGCIVQSIHPFYTEKSMITLPVIMGNWDAVKLAGDDVREKHIHPWSFPELEHGEYTAQIFDVNNRAASVKAIFFKIAGQIFCDFSPTGDPDINAYWLALHHPQHTVTKVLVQNDTLTLLPLDYDWLTTAITNNTLTIAHVAVEKDQPMLFVASPTEWGNILKSIANNPDAFPTKQAFVLKKRPAPSR